MPHAHEPDLVPATLPQLVQRIVVHLGPVLEPLRFIGNGIQAYASEPVVLYAAAALVAVLVVVLWTRRRTFPATREAWPAWALLAILSLALLLRSEGSLAGWLATSTVAAVPATFLARRVDRYASQERSRWRLVGVMAIVVLGALFRLYRLGRYPDGFSSHAVLHITEKAMRFHDELFPALVRLDFRTAREFSAPVLEQFGPQQLLEAVGFSLFGFDFTTARTNSAILGTLTVLLAYFAGKYLMSARLGACFAFLLATEPWHIAFSRNGETEHVLAGFQALLCLAFLFAWLRQGGLRYAAALGFALALSWYVYASNQVLLPFVWGIVVLQSLTRPVRARELAVMAVVFACASFPHLEHAWQGGSYLALRAPYHTETYHFVGLRDFSWNLYLAFGEAFLEGGDTWFGKPGGALRGLEAVMLFPALAYSMRFAAGRPFQAARLVPLGLFVFGLLPGVLGVGVFIRRLQLAAFGVLLLTALLAVRSYEALVGDGRRTSFWNVVILLLGAVVTTSAIHTYFDRSASFDNASNEYKRAAAVWVTSRLGREFVYFYVGTSEGEAKQVRQFVGLEGHERIRALKARGITEESLFRAITTSDLPELYTQPRSLHGRTSVVTSEPLTREFWNAMSVASAAVHLHPLGLWTDDFTRNSEARLRVLSLEPSAERSSPATAGHEARMPATAGRAGSGQ